MRIGYQRLSKSAGFVELDGWSCLELTGADRAKFLQNVCTNDVLGLRPGQGCEAFFTDVKGHVLAHVLVTCRAESLVLTRSAPSVADLIAHLDRYIIREDVQLHDRTADLQYILVVGQNSAEKLEKLPGASRLPQERTEALTQVQIEFGGVSCVLIRFPIAPPAWLLECPQNATQQIGERLVAIGIKPCDRDSWEAVRIEAGFPLDRVDITDRNLPQEIARDQRAISFNKGCYLGQETVARIDALGHVNQTLCAVRFSSDQLPPREMPLTADSKQVGRVSSACYSPREQASLALAYLRRGHNSPGRQLESEIGTATVVPIVI